MTWETAKALLNLYFLFGSIDFVASFLEVSLGGVVGGGGVVLSPDKLKDTVVT